MNPYAGVISGADSICPGDVVTFTNIISTGTWSTANIGVATISGTGQLTGIMEGLDTVMYIVNDSCGGDTALFPLAVGYCANGIRNKEAVTTSLSVFPNPVHNTFSIKLSSPVNEEALITITNMVGEKVKRFRMQTNTQTAEKLNAPPGIYFISALTNMERITKKLVVE